MESVQKGINIGLAKKIVVEDPPLVKGIDPVCQGG